MQSVGGTDPSSCHAERRNEARFAPHSGVEASLLASLLPPASGVLPARSSGVLTRLRPG